MVKEIPKKQRHDIFIEVLNNFANEDSSKLQYFLESLYKTLENNEKKEIDNIISEILKETDNDGFIILIIRTFPNKWKDYQDVARMRAENKIIHSIKKGYVHEKEGLIDGVLGTWVTRIFQDMILQKDLIETLIEKIDKQNRAENEYILEYLPCLIREIPNFDLMFWTKETLIDSINNGLSKGKIQYYKIASELKEAGDTEIFEEVEDNYEDFDEDKFDLDDDLPF